MLELNKIYCGDCLDFMLEMGDKSVDLVLTDPPYGLGDKLCVGGLSQGKGPIRMQELYLKSPWIDKKPTMEYFNEIFRISKNQIIWGGNYFNLPPCRCFICWDKIKATSNYSKAEYAWTSFDSVAEIFHFCSNGGFVTTKENTKQHPTQKPVELMEFCLLKYSKPNQIIFDPFAGSGTTGIACIKTNRNFILIEKEPEYVKVIEKRLAALPNTKLERWFQ